MRVLAPQNAQVGAGERYSTGPVRRNVPGGVKGFAGSVRLAPGDGEGGTS